jgi:raffinose/stachyose/melibiose transport system permease protein
MTASPGVIRSLVGVRQRGLRRGSPLLLLPAVVLLLAFYLLPNVLNLVLGLTDWNAFRSDIRFVGIDNFLRLAATDVLWSAVETTLVFAVATVVIQNVLALGLALALERTNRTNGLLRTIFFVPVLISPVAAGFVFRGLLAPDGTLNELLGGLVGSPVEIEWFGSTDFTIFVVAFISAWKWLGITMLIYIAGLVAIPNEIEEAARVDGANEWNLVSRVKLPLLAPAITANVVLTLIGSIGAFDVILATTKGGPARATSVINMVLYQYFGQGLFGIATAVNLVVFVMVVLASIPLIVYLRRREVAL